MTTYTILIILSGLVIFSYLFDLVASKTKVPSVLLLLLLGIGLRLLVDNLKIQTFNFLSILPTLGTVGLILIVFEGSLELKYDRHKNKIIRSAFFSALSILAGTIVVITSIIYQITHHDLYTCIANAIPFSVISSAIAIPSAAALNNTDKEFVIYESSFSDILGIIIFNFAITNHSINTSAFIGLGLSTFLILLLSAIACVVLLYVMGRLVHHIKFFLIIAILILVYAIGQSYHLSSLVLILSTGLFLNNADAIENAWFRGIFLYKNLTADLSQLYQLSAESAFILRTFFFVIFGFTMNISSLNDKIVLANGFFILISIYIIRVVFLKIFKKENLSPILYIAPRGLISILLYFNLPASLKIPEVGTPFLFLVVLGSSIVMTLGITLSKRNTVVH
ncbi:MULTISPECIES: cation:proton antiporter [unclassified Pedobacter]|uniref:cation:proton antiporter n=1 Tax=unclassified Pedobacter TaxID=2628915 RepID=UPI001420C93D|nr:MULTISPECIES: cation:proton antiporter [unclassified Pedobacter]NII83861.1 Kef-type K+ transport system membrane component KefB [Pedobacter sp. SG908]NMN37711.1 Kef-type K+ transport system membrane component KefB [Pedobacter sp. SG918]